MANEPNGRLHLASLSIRGFRGIRELDIPRLGRVTLLAGKNGVGKTAAIEAVQLYASRGQDSVWSEISTRHEEFAPMIDGDGDQSLAPNPAALFHGREVFMNSRMRIGPMGGESNRQLAVEIVSGKKQADFLEGLHPDTASDVPPLAIEVVFGNHKKTMPLFFPRFFGSRNDERSRFYRRFFVDQQNFPPGQACRSLGPGLPNNAEVAELWDGIVLTEDEEHAIRALNLVIDNKAERAATIGETSRRYRRQIVVKLHGWNHPVPLRSLGDGATRLFGVALALAGSRNGFLVIDEAENGLHHSVHDAFWRMILRTAEENNVQVFATTHSFDCVRGFARAAVDSPESEGVLVRLEKSGERTRAVVYPEADLKTAAEQNIEVR